MRKIVGACVLVLLALTVSAYATADIFEDHKDEIERLRTGKSISMTGFECTASVTTQITGGVEAEKLAAENGSAIGAFQLGRRYLKGIGVPRNFEQAMKYLEQSAAKDNAEALLLLGGHEVGMAIKSRKLDLATELLSRSQANGCLEASVLLGEIHRMKGELATAQKIFLDGAKSGLPLSFSRLVVLWLSHPDELTVDWVGLEKMIRPIAEQKNPSAMQNLATIYSALSKNTNQTQYSAFAKKHLTWTQMAAHGGESEAQWLWGVYRQSGVPGDDEADMNGVSWMKKSACQYSTYGRMNYARAIAQGLDKDVPSSLAANWYQTILMDPFVSDAVKRDAKQFVASLNRSALAADVETVDEKAAANFVFEQCYLDGNQNN